MSDIRTKLTDALAQTTHGFHSSQLDAIMPIIELSKVEAQIEVVEAAWENSSTLPRADDISRSLASKLRHLQQRRKELEEKTK